MITKQHIVDTAFRKMGMGRGETLTGFSGDEMADALDELETMMAEWERQGWQLYYQFAAPTDSNATVTPRPDEDSMLERSRVGAVASNLAVRLCPLYDMQPSAVLATEAYNDELGLQVEFTHVPNKSDATSTGYGLVGSGNLVKRTLQK
jgi:hypothetical protein